VYPFSFDFQPTITSEEIGLVFFIWSGSYILLVPFVGAIVDRKVGSITGCPAGLEKLGRGSFTEA